MFEDEKAENFFPLTYTRAVFDLRIGMYTILRRVEKSLGLDAVFVRNYLAKVYSERLNGVSINSLGNDENSIFINSRLILNEDFLQRLKEKIESKKYFTIFQDGDPIVIHAPSSEARELGEMLAEGNIEGFKTACRNIGERIELKGLVVEYPWDLIHLNTDLLVKDFSGYRGREWQGNIDERAVVYGNQGDIYIARGAEVEAYAVLDARKGPIYIGENSRVASGAVIEGPAYIGQNTLIVAHALIREGSNIGDVCRVGGEVEESIVQGFTNKYHTGFLGHAYVGEWVNLGALTTNSDLKDTYGTVKVNICGKRFDTGSIKVGCFIGDMAKTSIGTFIYTGKKIGVASHLHGIVYEDVPSFTIYAKSLGAEPVELYIDSAIEIQRRMMARRNRTPSKAEEELIRTIFQLTGEKRRAAGVKRSRFSLG